MLGLEVVLSAVVRCPPSERTQNRGSAASVFAFSRAVLPGSEESGAQPEEMGSGTLRYDNRTFRGTFGCMFSIVVIAVAIGVFTMYIRHEVAMRRKRRAELAQGSEQPPPTKPS